MATKEWSFGRSIFFAVMALSAALLVDQLIGCMCAPAQELRGVSRLVNASSYVTPLTADELIRQMSLKAAIIFTGEVVEVRRPAGLAGLPEDAAEGMVEIDFHVDQALVGAKSNSIYTVREWSGLWVAQTDRYRAGQHFLMLLRAPNAAGLTAPVHGSEGAIPLRGVGAAPGAYDDASSAAQWMVDIRWLQAQTVKQQSRNSLAQTTSLHKEGTPHSAIPASASAGGGASLLVHALPGPWILQEDATPEVESLAHVLEICTGHAESEDAR